MSQEYKPEESDVLEMDATGKFRDVVGISILGNHKDKFWEITCPCGVTASYPVNKLPIKDTPSACGRPNHWVVKYETAQ